MAVAERTLQQWDEGIEEVRTKHGAQSLAHTGILAAKDQLDPRLHAVHDLTTAIVRLGRVRHRANPHRARVFDYVKPDAKSRATILGAAERLAELWRKLDAAWVPLEDMALGDFDRLLEQATGAKKNVIVAEVGWLLAGAHHFKVMASNSRGDGAESEEAVIKVPAKQAA